MTTPPSYLSQHSELYAKDPRQAALRWFYEAKYGLFVHYGIYSLLGRHEWVQWRERIPVGAYATLADGFKADRFDPDWIAAFAIECGMRYVNLTTRHHDSFCLWDTRQTSFNVMNTPCGRDLVGELSEACQKRGLGLCLYYSHGRDWKHPHAPNNDQFGGRARPEYDPPEPAYARDAAHDLRYYLDFMTAQIEELLTQYGPIASIWLDGIAVPLHPKDGSGNVIENFDPRDSGDRFHCQKLYDHIRSLQPQCLIAYKDGYLGTEDFFAPEHRAKNQFDQPMGPDKPGEICTTAGGGWGYTAGHDYLSEDALWDKLAEARANDVNLLMNVGPMPDGSFPEQAQQTLRAVGQRIDREGFPPAEV